MKSSLKIGQRICRCLANGKVDPVVYTVVGTKMGFPIVADGWKNVLVRSWIKQP